MAADFKVGDLVWARMKGFPAWPGKVIEPKADVKKPAKKGIFIFVFFFGSENYAWIPSDNVWSFRENKDKFSLTTRAPKYFKEALEAAEEAVPLHAALSGTVNGNGSITGGPLPTIEEEIKQMFPERSSTSGSPPQSVRSSGKQRQKPVLDDHDIRNSLAPASNGRPKDRSDSATVSSRHLPVGGNAEGAASPREATASGDGLGNDKDAAGAKVIANRGRKQAAATGSKEVSTKEVPTKSKVAGGSRKNNEHDKEALTRKNTAARRKQNTTIIGASLEVAAAGSEIVSQVAANGVARAARKTAGVLKSGDAVLKHHIDGSRGTRSALAVDSGVAGGDASVELLKDGAGRATAPGRRAAASSKQSKGQPPVTPAAASRRRKLSPVVKEPLAKRPRTAASKSAANLGAVQSGLVKEKESLVLLRAIADEGTRSAKASTALSARRSNSHSAVFPEPRQAPASSVLRRVRSSSSVGSTVSQQPAEGAEDMAVPTGSPVRRRQAGLEVPVLPSGRAQTRPRATSADRAEKTSTSGASSSQGGQQLVGFLGLGVMGSRTARRLMKAGYQLVVWNRTLTKCDGLVAEGAQLGETPAEVVKRCDITFSCVSDPFALKELVFGDCGVLEAISPGKLFVDMSTVDIDTTKDIEEAVSSRGGTYVEAPILGSCSLADQKDDVVLAGGTKDAIRHCQDHFSAIAGKTMHLGSVGAGARMKLCVSAAIGVTAAAIAECAALAERVGLPSTEFFEVLSPAMAAFSYTKETSSTKGVPSSAGPSTIINAMATSDFRVGFALEHQQKDLRLAIDIADMVDKPMIVTAAANELYKLAKSQGCAAMDMAAICKAAQQ